MKKDRLYKVLKTLINECVDEMGLPKKPCVKAIHEANDVVEKYENELKENTRIKTTPSTPLKED
jgi:hypothetical protein